MLMLVAPVLVFSGIYIAIGLYFLFLYYRIPRLRSSHMQWFIATCFMAAAYNKTWVGIYTSTPPNDLSFWIWASHVVIPTLAITITGFLSHYVKDEQKWIIKSFYMIFGMFFLGILFAGKDVFYIANSIDGSIGILTASIPRFKMEAGTIVIALWMFLIFSIVYCFFHPYIWGLQGDKKEIIATIGAVAVLLVLVVSDIALYYKVISFIYINEYGFFFLMLAMCYGTINQIESELKEEAHSTKTAAPDDYLKDLDAELIKIKLLTLMHEEKVFTNENLSLDVAAKYLSLPPPKFSRFMNVVMDSDFRNFINRFRVEEAKRLLQTEPDLSIKQICYEVGFKSASTFHDSFKKFTGTSPGKFRKEFSE